LAGRASEYEAAWEEFRNPEPRNDDVLLIEIRAMGQIPGRSGSEFMD
jgi:hypothetical protein